MDRSPREADRTPEDVERAQRLESLGELASDAAHDFNNVLGVILGYVELARMGLGEEHVQAHRQLGLALSTVDRARELADGLLAFAPRTIRSQDLATLPDAVDAVCGLLTRTLDPRIEVAVTHGAAVPVTPLDRLGLEQVLTNLCCRAAWAMPTGGQLEVTTEQRVSPAGAAVPAGTYAVVQIRDSAGGAPPAMLAAGGEPRFVPRPQDRAHLSLWVARDLVLRHGGRIETESDGQGTLVRVWLPNALAVRTSAAASARLRETTTDVLVVDSDAAGRDVLRGYLEKAGLRVAEADSLSAGEAALRAPQAAVDLLMVAERFPDGAGAELIWLAAGLAKPPAAVLLAGGGRAPRLPASAARLAHPFLQVEVTRLLRDDLGIETG